MNETEHKAEKARRWEKMIREAIRSGLAIQGFCRQRQLQKSQFQANGQLEPPILAYRRKA